MSSANPVWRLSAAKSLLAASMLALTCGLAVPAHAQATLFDFGEERVGTQTALTETHNGISATFSSPADINGGGFQIDTSFFTSMSGNVLHDRGASGQQDLPLNISFNQNLFSMTLDFGTNDTNAASPLTLTAFLNGQIVGTTSATGTFESSGYPEGFLSFSSIQPFNSVTLTAAPASDFAVANLDVTSAAPVPEASSAASLGLLLALGLIIIVALRPKRLSSS